MLSSWWKNYMEFVRVTMLSQREYGSDLYWCYAIAVYNNEVKLGKSRNVDKLGWYT